MTAVSGPESQDIVAELGADDTVNYRETDIATLGAQFDVVFDTFGAVSPKVSRGLLVKGGLFLPLNFGPREIGALLLNGFRDRKIRLAVNEDRMEDMVRLAQLIEDGKLRPVVDRVFPFEDAALAHARVESRHKRGAIVLRIANGSE